MAKNRGKTHTTLTETALEVVRVLRTIPDINMIAPGIIKTNTKTSGKRFVTGVFTTAGLELIISGQSVQKVAVHCQESKTFQIFKTLTEHKKLSHIEFKKRERKPGV